MRGASVRNFGVAMLFPWSETIDITDVDGAIELQFREGLVFARDKAFAAVDHRREFIEAARELLAAQIQKKCRGGRGAKPVEKSSHLLAVHPHGHVRCTSGFIQAEDNARHRRAV